MKAFYHTLIYEVENYRTANASYTDKALIGLYNNEMKKKLNATTPVLGLIKIKLVLNA